MPAKKSPPVKAKSKRAPIVNELQDISTTNPIPFEGGRGFSITAESDYLPFLSTDDNYAQLLLETRLLSTTHNACVITKKDYCAGNGFQTIDELDITNKEFKDWIKNINVKSEDSVEINKQIFEYFFTFGNVPIEVVRLTIGGKRRLYVYVHNFLEWRLGKEDPDTGLSTYAVQSKLFLRNDNLNYLDAEAYKKAKKLPLFNPRNIDRATNEPREGYNWVKDGNGVERTLIWYKNSTAGFPNYGLPTAIASLIFQKLEYKGGRFNLDNLDNNLVVSAILSLKGSLSEPELNRIGRKIVKGHTGDGKRGRVIVVGSEEGIDGSEIHNLETQKDGSYEKSDEKWMQKIILANQWDAILAGIITASTMGKGVGFLTKIIEVKKNTVIVPAQNDLMRKVWTPIFGIANKWLGLGIDEEGVQIKNSIDISGLTDVDITPVVTVDEVRQGKGLPKAKKNGDKMLGELGADQKKGVYVQQKGGKQKPEDNVQEE